MKKKMRTERSWKFQMSAKLSHLCILVKRRAPPNGQTRKRGVGEGSTGSFILSCISFKTSKTSHFSSANLVQDNLAFLLPFHASTPHPTPCPAGLDRRYNLTCQGHLAVTGVPPTLPLPPPPSTNKARAWGAVRAFTSNPGSESGLVISASLSRWTLGTCLKNYVFFLVLN